MGTDPVINENVIVNPSSGERIVILQTAADTAGALLAWELRLAPDGKVPSGHSHPEQEERFTVYEGRMRFRVGFRVRNVGPGETVVVPPSTPHHFANIGVEEARVYVETRPALHMEELLRTAAGLAAAHTNTRHALPNPAELLLFMREFRSEVQAPFLPSRLTRSVINAMARLVVRLGWARRYAELRSYRTHITDPVKQDHEGHRDTGLSADQSSD